VTDSPSTAIVTVSPTCGVFAVVNAPQKRTFPAPTVAESTIAKCVTCDQSAFVTGPNVRVAWFLVTPPVASGALQFESEGFSVWRAYPFAALGSVIVAPVEASVGVAVRSATRAPRAS
jgi:hypothetical protein